jgi:hypothetical protein
LHEIDRRLSELVDAYETDGGSVEETQFGGPAGLGDRLLDTDPALAGQLDYAEAELDRNGPGHEDIRSADHRSPQLRCPRPEGKLVEPDR